MERLLPCDGRGLLKAILERSGSHSVEDGVLGRALKFSKSGINEKRLLRFIALRNLGRDDTKLIYDDVNYGRAMSTAD